MNHLEETFLDKWKLPIDDEYKLAQVLYWATDVFRTFNDSYVKRRLFIRARNICHSVKARTEAHYKVYLGHFPIVNCHGRLMIQI